MSTARTESHASSDVSPNQCLMDKPHPEESLARSHVATDLPQDSNLRQQILKCCRRDIELLPSTRAPSKTDLETLARKLLAELGISEVYVGWTMVVLSTEFWRSQVATVPLNQRLLLIPQVENDAQEANSGNMPWKKSHAHHPTGCICDRCVIDEIRSRAKSLGYRISLVGSSRELAKDLMTSDVEAIVGVASLSLLEKVMDRMQGTEIPSLAIPLNALPGESTAIDRDWVWELIEHHEELANGVAHDSYWPLLRTAHSLFEPAELSRLVPRVRLDAATHLANGSKTNKPTAPSSEPIAATEKIAHDFLCRGGKYARPFITLAAYDALANQNDVGRSDAAIRIPDPVRRVALSIETFHKASLIHDDIEDNDDYRYGQPALHIEHGLSTAINVGDYMIGLGYRLVSREIESLGPEVAGDIIGMLADAHLRLSEGQGAELLWRDTSEKRITPADALTIYALKTAPAFEVALLSGMRCAGPLGSYVEPLKRFSECLGIAFQILNDLKDWKGDDDNKLGQGLDTLGGRPTILWALALEGLDDNCRERLLLLQNAEIDPLEKIEQVRKLYTKAGVFSQTRQLVDQYHTEAQSIANQIEPVGLKRLLHYLLDSVLERIPWESPN